MKLGLGKNDIERYSKHNEGKSVGTKIFIRILKIKVYKKWLSAYPYIDKLDDIVRECNNTYHRTIKMKPIDVKDNTHFESTKEGNNKDPKFQVSDHVRISK